MALHFSHLLSGNITIANRKGLSAEPWKALLFPPLSSLKELEGVLTEEWAKILLETIHNLYETILQRIEAVIATKGGPTPY